MKSTIKTILNNVIQLERTLSGPMMFTYTEEIISSKWTAELDESVPIRVDGGFLKGHSNLKKIKKMDRDLREALKKGTDRQWVAAYKDP